MSEQSKYGKPVKIFCAGIVRYGKKCESGFLPVFSVETEQDAEDLLRLACGTNLENEFVAVELTGSGHTLTNLHAFSDRLEKTWAFIVARRAGQTDVECPRAPLPKGA